MIEFFYYKVLPYSRGLALIVWVLGVCIYAKWVQGDAARTAAKLHRCTICNRIVDKEHKCGARAITHR